MQVRLEKTGDCLVISIPAELAAATELEQGSLVDISVTNGHVVLTPIKPRFTIEELVAGITDENKHAGISTGRPVGKEVW